MTIGITGTSTVTGQSGRQGHVVGVVDCGIPLDQRDQFIVGWWWGTIIHQPQRIDDRVIVRVRVWWYTRGYNRVVGVTLDTEQTVVTVAVLRASTLTRPVR